MFSAIHCSTKGFYSLSLAPADKIILLYARKHVVTRDDLQGQFATLLCNMVATLFPVEPIVLQHCNAVLRLKWSLRIVPWNITLKRCEMIFKEALVTIGFHEKKHIFCKKITCNQPAKTQSTKSQCLLFIMSGQ